MHVCAILVREYLDSYLGYLDLYNTLPFSWPQLNAYLLAVTDKQTSNFYAIIIH